MPAQPTDADEIRHLLRPVPLEQPLPGGKGEGVVLARLHSADEQRVRTRPRRLAGVELARRQAAGQAGHPTEGSLPARSAQ